MLKTNRVYNIRRSSSQGVRLRTEKITVNFNIINIIFIIFKKTVVDRFLKNRAFRDLWPGACKQQARDTATNVFSFYHE